MKNWIIWLSSVAFVIVIFAGCSAEAPSPVAVKEPTRTISYLHDVKPIMDKRCVPCHSCYNSPCQLKLSSFEGADRGASKELVYKAERLLPQDPTRLFIDANSTEAWREKSFFSVTENSAEKGFNNSTMAYLLRQKMQNPISKGEYKPELDTLSCAKNAEEVGAYLDKHPNRGMPYGFPALTEQEYGTVLAWLQQGAHGPTAEEQMALERPSPAAQAAIEKWEAFFNAPDAKHKMTARYLYEHLFLAHLNFPEAPDEFYEIVRSETPSPQKIKVIATVRPFDDPEREHFYYRIRKIHATIVHKTHIVFTLDDREYERINTLFIDIPWVEKPHVMDYDEVNSANPFVTFEQIPPKSRYRFLLNNSEYVIRTFIRGPVCKGQIALNVINDHFWVMFMDPDADATIQDPAFLKKEQHLLSMPIEIGSSVGLFSAFSDRYRDLSKRYIHDKGKLYTSQDKRMSLDSIWKGEADDDAPILTVYRHFDSATVLRGVKGDLPRTMWVIDYPQFERIYYALVAGFDVFGNLAHQTNIRRYMDFLRIEGELNFLAFLPDEKRLPMLKSWYLGDKAFENVDNPNIHVATDIKYSSDDVKKELVEMVVKKHIPKSLNIHFDKNYQKTDHQPTLLPTVYKSEADYIHAFNVVSRPGTAFMRVINGSNSNLAYIRIKMRDGSDRVISVVINRWHDNVNALFGEEDRLDPTKDTADFIPGSVGSYPNLFFVVKEEELPDFFNLLEYYDDTPEDIRRLLHYGIARSNADFWKHYDWFQEHYYEEDPKESGMYDLNRYYQRAW